jgi:NAD(P)H-hydrate epimerase
MQSSLPAVEIVIHLPTLVPRPAESNKGTLGRVLVVAASRGMSGAAVLCATAALRGGAGLVQVAVPAEVLPIVAAANPCYLTATLLQDEHGQVADGAEATVLQLAAVSDAVALGPGLGRSPAVARIVARVVAEVAGPLVLDADGINALQQQLHILRLRKAPTVLTPHPGEFARLLGIDVASVQARRQELAVQFAGEHGVVLVLKGHGTLVSDGRRLYRNTTGNPGDGYGRHG